MYLGLKLLHLVAVMLFRGNITTGVFWKEIADRTKDPRIIAHTMAGIIRSDRLFTVPGVVWILIGGFGAAILGHYPLLHTRWISWSIVLFTISGIAFMARLVPLQRSLLQLARAGEGGEMDWPKYHAQSRQWAIWGLIALAAPIVAMGLMVTKPQ